MASNDYRIVQGDTLSDVAEDHGLSLSALKALNPNLFDSAHRGGNLIHPGEIAQLRKNLPGQGVPARTGPGGSNPSLPVRPGPPAHPFPGVVVNPTGPIHVGTPGPGSHSGTGAATVSTKAAPPVDTYQQLMKQLSGVPGAERDAFAALNTLFTGYGLGSLAPKILQFLQAGFGADTITSLLQQTTEYKARFSGNDARIKNGLQVLTPAEYLSTEASYRQLLQAGGLDPAFMNSGQYSEWIGKDISPTEIQSRVNDAVAATTAADPTVLRAFAQMGIHAGDLASYFLNDKNPMPQLQLKLSQAQIIGAGLQSGVQTSNSDALLYAQRGVTYSQAQNAQQRVADVAPAGVSLSDIYKSQNPYSASTAQQEFLGQNGQAQLARENLGRQETATFSGEGGVGQKSFAQQTAGTGF